jgi:hypothetical protein
VPVETRKHGGTIGDQRIQLLARRKIPGEGFISPAHAFNPGALGMSLGESLDAILNFGKRTRAVQPYVRELQASL